VAFGCETKDEAYRVEIENDDNPPLAFDDGPVALGRAGCFHPRLRGACRSLPEAFEIRPRRDWFKLTIPWKNRRSRLKIAIG